MSKKISIRKWLILALSKRLEKNTRFFVWNPVAKFYIWIQIYLKQWDQIILYIDQNLWYFNEFLSKSNVVYGFDIYSSKYIYIIE